LKKWAILILMLMSLSWMTSLAEDFACDEASHEVSAEIHEERSADGHSCHVGTCHFGHCAHIHVRLAFTLARESESPPGRISTPYSFALTHAPLFFLMRPPLAFA
jgi:hypothetical protein